jgi:hypothetical protein
VDGVSRGAIVLPNGRQFLTSRSQDRDGRYWVEVRWGADSWEVLGPFDDIGTAERALDEFTNADLIPRMRKARAAFRKASQGMERMPRRMCDQCGRALDPASRS